MQKPKLKLFIFITFLLATNNITSMDFTKTHNTENHLTSPEGLDDQNNNNYNENECAICFDEIDEELSHQLTCGHKFCKVCISNYLKMHYDNNTIPSCPICQKIFVAAEYDELRHINNLALILKEKYELEESNFIKKNKDHRNVRGLANDHAEIEKSIEINPGLKQIIKIFALPAALLGYAIYRFYRNQKKRKDQSADIIKKDSPNRVSKKFDTIKRNILNRKSDIFVTALASSALFMLLDKQSVNLATPINSYAYRKLGDNYWNIISSVERNKFLRALKNQFDNGCLINVGLSFCGGLLVGYLNKLLSGTERKSKKNTVIADKKISAL